MLFNRNETLVPYRNLFCGNKKIINRKFKQGFGAGAARSQGIWLEPEQSLWPGSGSTLYIC